MAVLIEADKNPRTDLAIELKYELGSATFFLVAMASICCGSEYKDDVANKIVQCTCAKMAYSFTPGSRFYLVENSWNSEELKTWLQYWTGHIKDEIEVDIEWSS